MVADRARYADPAGFGQSFQSGRNIHAVAVDVSFLYDYVAEIDADPEDDPLIIGCFCVPFLHFTLDRDSTGDGLNDARELDQEAIAGRLDDAALVFTDFGVDQFAAMGSEP